MENQILKKIEWKQDGRPFGWGGSPDGDWKLIFISTLVLIVLVSAWNYLTFMKVSGGEIFIAEDVSTEEVPLLDVEGLKNAVLYYEIKALEFEKIKNGTTTSVVDPSL